MAEGPTLPQASIDMAAARRALVEEVEDEVRRYGDGAGGTALEPKVRDALGRVPREAFVPPEARHLAYRNRPLPIGHGQTISQPLVVALMTHHLALGDDARVLDVGTGSGYQTALLAELARAVVTVEIVAPLATAARAVLEEQGYRNITYLIGDGATAGAAHGPYDGILVAAAAPRLPEALVSQLKPGGRLVIPIGGYAFDQDLRLVTRDEAGRIHDRSLFQVAFVPLIDGPPPAAKDPLDPGDGRG